MPPKKKTSTAPAAKKTAGRARARAREIVVSPNVPVVFGRVVFIKHILLFALDIKNIESVETELFPWRGVNSAWHDTIHNFMNHEVWRPLVSRMHDLRWRAAPGSDSDNDEEEEEEDTPDYYYDYGKYSIANMLFCSSNDMWGPKNDGQPVKAATLTDGKAWVIRLLHEKGGNAVLTTPFVAVGWEEVNGEFYFDEDKNNRSVIIRREFDAPMPAFAHALVEGNLPLLELIAELLNNSAKHTVNAPVELVENLYYRGYDTVSDYRGPISPLYAAVVMRRTDIVDFLLAIPGARDPVLKAPTALQALVVPWDRIIKAGKHGCYMKRFGSHVEEPNDMDDFDKDDAFFERTFRALVAQGSKKYFDHECNRSAACHELTFDYRQELKNQTALTLCMHGYSNERWKRGLHYAGLLMDAGATLPEGADPSPYYVAVQRFDKTLVKFLLDHGVDPDCEGEPVCDGHQHRGEDCRSCCDDCALFRAGDIGAESLLFRRNLMCGRPHCECSGIPELGFKGGLPLLQLMIDAGAEFPKQLAAPEVYVYVCPLTVVAALNGNVDLLRTLVSRGVPLAQLYRTGRSIGNIGERRRSGWSDDDDDEDTDDDDDDDDDEDDDEDRATARSKKKKKTCKSNKHNSKPKKAPREVPAGNISALAVAADKQNVDMVRFIVDEVKCPLHWRLFGGYDKDTDAAATRLADADDAEHLAQVSALDAPSRQFVHHLRSAATTAAARRYVDDLEARLAVQFAEFAAACRSGSIKRVKAFVAEHGAARCHWPDTDAPDFVKSVKGQEQQQQVVNADAFIRGGQKTLRMWVGKSQPPAALSISRADPSWTGFSKMTLQKVFCYTPAASRKGVVDFLVQQMEESAYNCL